MQSWLDLSKLFLKIAQSERINATDIIKVAETIEEIKENKRNEVRKELESGDLWSLFKKVKAYYQIIKGDTKLFDDIAEYFAGRFRNQSFFATQDFSFNKNHKELCDLIFKKVIEISKNDYPINRHRRPIPLLESWASFLSPDLIRDYIHSLLSGLKEYPERNESKGSGYWDLLNIIGNLARNSKIRKYINAPLLDRILSNHDTYRLPPFNPKQKKFHTIDILKMLKSGFTKDELNDLDFPKLLDIISKSTPQAQELLRSVLWQSYSGYSNTSKKFMLDSEFKPINVSMKPVEVYGKISPAHTSSWNIYATEEMAEKTKWKEVFSDFNIVPFIDF